MFAEEAKRIFAFLLDHGFVQDDKKIEMGSIYISVPYHGQNIGIVLGFEQMGHRCVDCIIRRLRNGELANLTKGGVRIDLDSYLIKYKGHRSVIKSGIPKDLPPRQGLAKSLEAYAAALKTQASELLEDRSEIWSS